MLAVVPVRDGQLPLGGAEAVAEAGGRALLVGDGCVDAVDALAGVARSVRLCGAAALRTGRLGRVLAACWPTTTIVVLPASPNGRDLAPRLAALAAIVRCCAGAVRPAAGRAGWPSRAGSARDVAVDGPSVVTLQPGVRGVEIDPSLPRLEVADLGRGRRPRIGPRPADAELVDVLPPDPATMDLAEAPRIVGGGAGLGSAGARTARAA